MVKNINFTTRKNQLESEYNEQTNPSLPTN